MFNMSEEELCNLDAFGIVDTTDPNFEILKKQRSLTGEASGELTFIRKDGTRFLGGITSHVFLNDRGEERTSMIIRDKTERLTAEKRIRETESRYKQIVELALEGIWMIDTNDKTSYVNKAMADMFGYTRDEMIGKDLYYFMDDEGRKIAEANIERRKQGIVEAHDFKFNTKNGKTVWTIMSATPIFNGDQYAGALAMVTDITERKQADNNLRELSNRLGLAARASNAGIWDWDIINNKIEWDKSMYELYGVADFGNAFESWSQCVHPDDLEQEVKKLNDAADGIADLDTEFRIIWPDGSIKYVRSMAVVERDENGTALRMVGTNWDNTEQKLAIKEIEKIVSDLIQRNKDLEQFAYIISHNLRAPVANVIGLSQLLEQDSSDEVILNGISQSIKKIDEVIIDLTDILQSRQLVNDKKEPVCLKELVEDIKLSINNIVEQERVAIQYDFEDIGRLPTIRSYMYSILYNLILNGIKYRKPDEPPVITVKGKKTDDFIDLVVTDNGKGIDLQKNGASLFGLYKRFDPTVEGRGIGLYMAKTQIEAMGGMIEAQSEVGKGTTFFIKLPV
jgi:PAS domain S-box-containing protein